MSSLAPGTCSRTRKRTVSSSLAVHDPLLHIPREVHPSWTVPQLASQWIEGFIRFVFHNNVHVPALLGKAALIRKGMVKRNVVAS